MTSFRQHHLMSAAGLSVLAASVALALWFAMSRPPNADAATVTIQVDEFWFCDANHNGVRCDTTINAGDMVTWDFSAASVGHSTTACGPSCENALPKDQALWHSGTVSSGQFQHTFSTPGEFLYHCQVHPLEMRGKIIVLGPARTATPTRTRPPTPMGTPPPPGRAGDVNCDGAVTAVDAALMLQLDARLVTSLRCQQNGDVNGSGSINALDAVLVLQFGAGFLDHLPA